MIIATYLNFNGNCEEALNTYKNLFNANLICFYKYEKGMTNIDSLIGKVFHAEIKIHDFYFYMGDIDKNIDSNIQNYKIVVECDSLDEAIKYHNALKEKGEEISPIEKMPWGPFIGHVKDCYGVHWNFVYCK